MDLSELELARLQDLGYNDTRNCVGHDGLTKLAMEILQGDMERYGNRLSEQHSTALYEILASYTRFAQGTLRGRYAYPLDCGLGQSLSVVAWLAALHQIGADHISVVVAASKVEALCDMKRKLLAHGVPESKIGLVHSYNYEKGEASLPSTGDHDSRQILLVTHARIRGGRGFETYNTFKGTPRTFAIWDEALLVADARTVSARHAFAEFDWMKRIKADVEDYAPLIARLGEADVLVAQEVAKQREHGAEPSVLRLPALTESEHEDFTQRLKLNPRLTPLADLLAMWHEPLRIAPTTDGDAVITYRLVVPRELPNVAVLDATYEVRRLENLNDNVKIGSKWHVGLKDYSEVSVLQVRAPGGRESITKDFRSKNGRYADMVVDFVREVPEDEAIIVFTFKSETRGRARCDFEGILRHRMATAGIDVDSTLDGGRPRIIFRTWGQHEGDSDYSYARHVVLCGVLHRSRVELAGAFVGEMDDLEAKVTDADIAALVASEKAHCVHQALSRGACRVTRDGMAGRMRALIIDRSLKLREDLAPLTPGITWRFDGEEEAEKKREEARKQKVRPAERIAEHLLRIGAEVRQVSVRELKGAMGDHGIPANTFTRGLHEAARRTGWTPVGRSLVRCGS